VEAVNTPVAALANGKEWSGKSGEGAVNLHQI